MFYFIYCKNCALKEVNGDCSCTCSLVALRVPETCFWPAKTRKELSTFWDAYMALTGCSKMVQTWMMETGYSFSLTSLFWWKWLIPLLEWVLYSYVSDFRLKLSRIWLWRKRSHLDSKSYLSTNGLILGFFVQKWLPSLTSYLHGLESSRIAQFLFVMVTSNFFDV